MNIQIDELETIWHLEMLSSDELNKKTLPAGTQLQKLGIPLPALNRFFYLEVGKFWQWTTRLQWTGEQWRDWVERDVLQTWMLIFSGTPAGYFELETQDEAVEIAYFGLLPQFVGKGLGGGMLSAAIEKAWELKRGRVWVHTCSFDHPHALKNYQARGFHIFRESQA
ncbi:MAG: GNAT family N-acetyltransferase [SAR324 cluster bacterium]|nr:GNAT family N-acetyltransferase [SAR324 cluster bacterium]MBL7034161.1 GNAT family N-acetyltransferase [SAR324 cluster bacterium]